MTRTPLARWIVDRMGRQWARTCGKVSAANQDVVGRVQVIKAVANPMGEQDEGEEEKGEEVEDAEAQD